MNDFKSEYQLAVQDMELFGMEKIHIDAFSVLDERRHRRRVVKRVQRATAVTFSAACVIFLCGFGTVKAAEYIGNVIKVNEWGFESGDSATMARGEGGTGQSFVLVDEVELVSAGGQEDGEETLEPPVLTVGNMTAQDGGAGIAAGVPPDMTPGSADSRKMQDMEDTASVAAATADTEMADMPGADGISMQKMPPEAAGAGAADMQEEMALKTAQAADACAAEALTETESEEEVFTEEIPVKNYSSWEACMAEEDFIFSVPAADIGVDVEYADITVCGDWVMARYDAEGKVLWLERTDYGNTQGHASSKVFPGGVCNERSHTTPQGYTYTLIDSVRESGEETLQIHAAVSVGNYEAFIDFMGYTEEEAKEIMDSIDLSVYE